MNPGDTVRFETLPQWVDELPEESHLVFRACLGKSFSVIEVDANGFNVLDVSKLIDHKFGGTGNDIRVEDEYLAKI
jgi:hypothetical protein